MYTCAFDNISVTNDADQDVWLLTAPANRALILHWFELYSALASAEFTRMRLLRRTTAGSGGSSATVNPLRSVSATVAATVTQLVTAPGTAGAVLMAWQFAQISPQISLPTPETRVWIPPSGMLALHLQTAVATTRTWSGFLVFEEVG